MITVGDEVVVCLWGTCVGDRAGFVVGVRPTDDGPLYEVDVFTEGHAQGIDDLGAIETLFLYDKEMDRAAW